jgi:hypothetical protein
LDKLIEVKDLKVFLRWRAKQRNDPALLLPHQAVLWFKPEGRETIADCTKAAARLLRILKTELKWSDGALGKVTGQLVGSKTSVGLLFSHMNYARQALQAWSKKQD